MNQKIFEVLKALEEGKTTAKDAYEALKIAPFSDMGYAKVDHHRTIRQGYCEVIYGEGKNCDQIFSIVGKMMENQNHNILITRLDSEKAQILCDRGCPLDYDAVSRTGIANPKEHETLKEGIVIATGGTCDVPVAEEAARTLHAMGYEPQKLYDVGVSGIHRLFAQRETLAGARAVIAVAGMEGALASVIGGMVDCPVIAVPTSVGYGTAFGGVTALLSMLNSCSAGVCVMNIDNGFGAAVTAYKMLSC